MYNTFEFDDEKLDEFLIGLHHGGIYVYLDMDAMAKQAQSFRDRPERIYERSMKFIMRAIDILGNDEIAHYMELRNGEIGKEAAIIE